MHYSRTRIALSWAQQPEVDCTALHRHCMPALVWVLEVDLQLREVDRDNLLAVMPAGMVAASAAVHAVVSDSTNIHTLDKSGTALFDEYSIVLDQLLQGLAH